MKYRVSGLPRMDNGGSFRVAGLPQQPVDVMSGGYLKRLSHNPYDGGTYEAVGNSHEDGGMAVDSTGNGIPNAEIEGGETVHVSPNNGVQQIGGNMTIPGTNRKFKQAFKGIAKAEEKAVGLATKAARFTQHYNQNNKYGRLAFNSAKVMKQSADNQLAALAMQKENLADYQNNLKDLSENIGMDPKRVSRMFNQGGQLVPNKYKVVGTPMKKGLPSYAPGGQLGPVTGRVVRKPTMADRNNNPGNMRDIHGNFIKFNSLEEGLAALRNKLDNAMTGKSKVYHPNMSLYDFYNKYSPASDANNPKRIAETVAKNLGVDPKAPISALKDKRDKWADAIAAVEGSIYGDNVEFKWEPNTTPTTSEAPKEQTWTNPGPQEIVPLQPVDRGMQQLPVHPFTPPIPQKQELPGMMWDKDFGAMYDRGDGWKVASTGKTLEESREDAEAKAARDRAVSLTKRNKLGVGQFLPEMLSLADKPDFVPHQRVSPELFTPYSVTFQDKLNENTRTFNATANQLTNNPAALASLAAQKYGADSAVLADEFRTNQGIQNEITNKNISLINAARDEQLKLDDQQYVRQTQALENTRANQRTAMQSITAKIAAHRAEQNQIRLLEGTNGFLLDPKTNRMVYVGPKKTFTASGSTSSIAQKEDDDYEEEEVYRKSPTTGEQELYTIKKKRKSKWGGMLRG